jgi:hypothetical protein
MRLFGTIMLVLLHLPVLRAALLRHQQAVLADQADQPVARKSLAA